MRKSKLANAQDQIESLENLASEAVNLLSRVVERWGEGQDDECSIPHSTIERIRMLVERLEKRLAQDEGKS